MFNEWEITLLQIIQSIGTGPEPVMTVITDLVNPLPIIILFLFVYNCLDHKLGVKMLFYLNAARFLTGFLKNTFRAPRPFYDKRIKLLYRGTEHISRSDLVKIGYGMPSGHALVSSAFYGSPAWSVKNIFLKFSCIFFPLVIGFTRLYLGFHTPLQVLAGHLIGFGLIILVEFSQEKVIDLVKNKKTLPVTGFLVGLSLLFVIALISQLYIFEDIRILEPALRFKRISDPLQGIALVTGTLTGAFLFSKKGRLLVRNRWWKRICRFFISFVCMALLIGPALILAKVIGPLFARIVFIYVMMFFAGFCITYLVPLFFIKINLTVYDSETNK